MDHLWIMNLKSIGETVGKKIFLYLLVVGLFVLLFISGYFFSKKNFPAKIHHYVANWTYEEVYKFSDLSELSPKPNQGFHQFLDSVRYFVHDNSVRGRLGDGTYGVYQNNRPLVIKRLLKTKKEGAAPPELLCSSRVGAMQQILDDFGYQSRMTHLFAQGPGSHTFLEVRNPDTNEWEIQDPDYNLVYEDLRTGKRLGVNDIVLKSLSSIVPCKRNDDCSWDYAGVLLTDKYYGAAMVFDWKKKPPVLLINRNRFDFAKPLEFDVQKRSILQYVQDFWGNDYNGVVDIVVSGSSYEF
jgi:hypothetical protein